MQVKELLAEYGLEIDDIRWYLAGLQAERLLAYAKKKHELTQLLWSGKLEAELYHMDERFLDEVQEKLSLRIIDEAEVRKTLSEIREAKRRRRD